MNKFQTVDSHLQLSLKTGIEWVWWWHLGGSTDRWTVEVDEMGLWDSRTENAGDLELLLICGVCGNFYADSDELKERANADW